MIAEGVSMKVNTRLKLQLQCMHARASFESKHWITPQRNILLFPLFLIFEVEEDLRLIRVNFQVKSKEMEECTLRRASNWRHLSVALSTFRSFFSLLHGRTWKEWMFEKEKNVIKVLRPPWGCASESPVYSVQMSWMNNVQPFSLFFFTISHGIFKFHHKKENKMMNTTALKRQ